MKIEFSKNVKDFSHIFTQFGYEIYAVGGVVRDGLLGRKTTDIDFCTSATPEEMLRLFPHAIKTGIKHGTLTLPFRKAHYEVTTYRLDGVYTDGRHPNSVNYSANLKEDLKRRDFTINAMAASPENGTVIDEFGGEKDLKRHVIRTVGNPNERFREDALRILRAVRFGSKLNFTIEEKTFEAMKSHAENLENVSKERIKNELWGTLEADGFKTGLKYIIEAELFDKIFPFLKAPSLKSIDELLEFQQNVEKTEVSKAEIRFAALLYITRATIEEAKKSLDFLKCSNKEAENIMHLYKCSLVDIHTMKTPYRKRNFLALLKREYFEPFFALLETLNLHTKEQKRKYAELLSSPLSIKELAVNGNDLVALGIKGKDVGSTLNKCLDAVLEEPELNEKDKLLALLKAKGGSNGPLNVSKC